MPLSSQGNSPVGGFTIEPGTVTTLPPGSAATATLRGNAPRFYLDLGIPAGQAGTNGTNATTAADATATVSGLMPSAAFAKLAAMPAYAARSFASNPARALVNVPAAANGWQVDAARDALVGYAVAIDTTFTLTGSAKGTAFLEVCATNSATASDWTEIDRVVSGDGGVAAAGVTMAGNGGGSVRGVVPAGWYVRVRTATATTGTGAVAFTLAGRQEVKL